MKKTLVALAALATVGAAFAQSTVTLYGRVDVNLTSFDQKTGGVRTPDNNVGAQLATGNAFGETGSRWGLKGSEDLGGGMKAIFQLENGFAADNGNLQQGGRQFGRQAYVGLGGGFGTLTFGRQYSPLDAIWGSYDAQGYYTTAPISYAWNNGPQNYGSSAAVVGVHNDTGRISNAIMYATPAMSGFSGAVMWAPGENKIPGVNGATQYWGFNAQYANGPIGIGLGYENTEAKTAAFSAKMSNWTLGGQYDFGVAKVYAMYERGRSNIPAGNIYPTNAINGIGAGAGGVATGAGTDRGWDIGFTIPVGAANVGLSYAEEKTEATGTNVTGKNKAIGANVNYSLSKRTTIYAIVLDGSSTTAANVRTKNTAYSLGVRHEF
jgi:predicted porin